MSIHTVKDSDFSCQVVKVLRSQPIDAKNRMDLRVVKWSRSPKPVLEKRRIWMTAEGERPSKLAGLDVSDVKYIFEHYAEILNLM